MCKKMQKLLTRVGRSLMAVLLSIAMLLPSFAQPASASQKPTVNSLAQTEQPAKASKTKSVVVVSQAGLNKALADKNITSITIKTTAKKEIVIPDKAYKAKTLIVNGSNLTLINGGLFKSVVITNAKAFTEEAKDNHIKVNDKKLSLLISSEAAPKSVTFDKAGSNTKLTIDGKVKEVLVSKKANLTLSGRTASKILISLEEDAANTQLASSIPLSVNSATDAKIVLKKGAEKSTITLTQNTSSISLVNETKKSITIKTPDGKSSVRAGTTLKTKAQPKPSPVPEKEEAKAPTPTMKPDNNSSDSGSSNDGSTTTYYTLRFDSQGGTSVEPMRVASGNASGTLPTPQKNNSIFLGWYSDSSYQTRLTETTPIYSNLNLYAKYSEILTEQQLLDDSFSLIDQSPSLTFTIISTDSSMSTDEVKSALNLQIADGSGSVVISVTGGSGNYQMTATEGFTEGSSYKLTLNDNRLSFQNKESSIRNCSFSIAKAEIFNIALNEEMIYIPSSEVKNMIKNGSSTQALSVAIVSMSTNMSGDDEASGSFTYQGNRVLNAGDVLCIYSGERPEAPGTNEDDSGYLDDNIAYITVDSVSGAIGNQTVRYADAEAEEVIFMPDVLPINAGEGNKLLSPSEATAVSGSSIQIRKVDLGFSDYQIEGLDNQTTVDRGDFIALYYGAFSGAGASDTVNYGEVTEVTEENGILTISYQPATEEQLQQVLNYHSKNDVDSEAMLEDVDVAALERDIELQVVESGFAEEASKYLTALAMETDGFKKIARDDFVLESMSVKLPKDYEEDLEAMSIMSMSSKVSIENLKIKANIGTKLQKLSGSGVRCGVTVSFDVPIETGEESAIVISISATFIEEVKIAVNASGNAIWKWKWIFPYIADYQMNANIDLYDYTGISFKAVVSTAETGSTDISEEIQKILSSTKSEQITSGVQELFEIYGEMMENESDWVDIFSQNIVKSNMYLLLGIINIRTTIDFVVAANVNVAIGCNFEYQSGTRYCFWAKVKARDAGSNQIDLMDEKYTFQFYVMGMLGLRAGIRLEVAVGLFTVDLNSVGLTAEAGVYAKLYGYFFYQLESVNKVKNSKMSGALYLDFGIYLEIAFKAQVLNGKYQYNPTLFEKEWPLLSVGTRYNVYNFAYEDTKKIIKMKDKVRSYLLPDSTFNMTYLDLREGDISTKTYKVSDYNVTFSNPSFSLSGNTINVSVPNGTHKLEGTMTVTWKGGPLAFSSLPISRTYYLIWDDINENGYTITYKTNGGSLISNVTKKYEERITAPSNPTRNGYTFEGWYSDDRLTSRYSFQKMPANNLILYAKWTVNTNTQYKVEHYQQNLLNDAFTRYSVDTLAGTTDTTATAAAKNFSGFTYNSAVTGTVASGKIAADGSLVLKLYYSRNSYNLTFKPDNGGADIVKSVKFGSAVSAPTLVKEGYTLQGWNQTVATTMPAMDITYTARWTPANYTIRFNTNGGSNRDSITQAYGTAVNTPSAPTKLGYLFSGWYKDEALTTPYNFTTMPSENITVNAKWVISNQIDYKIEHYQQNITDNGYTLKETESYKGSLNNVVTATDKNYAGFTFKPDAKETILSGAVRADGSLVLKLYYDRNSYTLTFKPENEELDIVSTLKYGAAITAPSISKAGYTFVQWNQPVAATMPAENVTYTASWTPILYTITFDTNGEEQLGSIVQAAGTDVTEPLPQDRVGYLFDGWYSDEALTLRYTFGQMPAENLTLYAKWVTVVPAEIIEAESATLYGSSASEGSAMASGGAHVGFIDVQNGSGVRFDNMRASEAIYLRYASVSTGYINIYVNGSKWGRVNLEASGDFTTKYKIVRITELNLAAEDSLAFQYDSIEEGNIPINFDYIAYSISNPSEAVDVQPSHGK